MLVAVAVVVVLTEELLVERVVGFLDPVVVQLSQVVCKLLIVFLRDL